jgi:hypothetical protein
LRALSQLPPGVLEEAVAEWQRSASGEPPALVALTLGLVEVFAAAEPEQLPRVGKLLTALAAHPSVRDDASAAEALRQVGLPLPPGREPE